MDQRKKIVIEGDGKSFTSAIQRMKQDVRSLSEEFLKEGRNSKSSGKESLMFLEEQIKAMQRKNKLALEGARIDAEDRYKSKLAKAKTQKEKDSITSGFEKRMEGIKSQEKERNLEIALLKDIAENIKTLAKTELDADPKEVQKAIREAERNGFAGLSEEEIAKIRMQQDMISESEGKDKDKVSNFAQIIGAGVVRDVGAIIKQMPNASTGLDLLTPVSGLAGMITGGAVGAGVGFVAGAMHTGTGGTAMGRGTMEGFAIGSELGKQVGEFAGSTLTRTLSEQENLLKNYYSLVNLTGKNPGKPNLSSIGISAADGLQIQSEFSRSSGRNLSLKDLKNTLSFRSRGIDQSTMSEYFNMERTGGGNAPRELSRLIGVLETIPTINRAIYNDIASSQLSLMQNMRQTQNIVSGREALRTTLAFNQLGGQYDAKNPLAGQNIISARNSMANPSNDFVQARQLSILREMFPDASYIDLLEKQQNPTAEIMQAFLSEKGMEGIPEEYRAFGFAQAYGGGNIARGRSLTKGLKLPGVDKFANVDNLFTEAESRTPEFERQRAEITDAYLKGPIEGLDAVRKAFGDTMKQISDKEMERINMEEIITNKFKKAVDGFDQAVNGLNNGSGRMPR